MAGLEEREAELEDDNKTTKSEVSDCHSDVEALMLAKVVTTRWTTMLNVFGTVSEKGNPATAYKM